MKIFFLRTLATLYILVAQGCDIVNVCKDAKFGFARVENLSDTLRIDGYYYGGLSGRNSNRTNIYVLYRNGVFLNRLSFDLDDAQSGNVDLTLSDLAFENKGFWGVYRLDSTQIEIQSWIPRPNGCVHVFTEKGVILNDSTFEITSWQSSRDDEIRHVNAIFRFVQFSPKPDSVVSFIP